MLLVSFYSNFTSAGINNFFEVFVTGNLFPKLSVNGVKYLKPQINYVSEFENSVVKSGKQKTSV